MRKSFLSDIKREAQPSVLYLIKHDYKCFKWLKKRLILYELIGEVIFKIDFV
jgi:hypothetical protein